MTFEQAMNLCAVLPEDAVSSQLSGWRTHSDAFAAQMRTIFPEFNWRVILSRAGERTRWVMTVDDKDPREHYVPRGRPCICCGKTLAELQADGVNAVVRDRDDD